MQIEINLLPGAKKKKRGGGLSLELPDFRALATQIKDPLLLSAIGSITFGLLAVGVIWFMEKDRISGLEPELEAVRRESLQFESMIAERNRQQVLRDSLLLDLSALQTIDGDRFVWPHILDEVTRALPDFTWIVSLDVVVGQDSVLDDGSIIPAPVVFTVDGRTREMQGVTRFISQLESSQWLRNVRSGGTQTVVESDQPVTSFEVTAMFHTADSMFIRTVPLSQPIGPGS